LIELSFDGLLVIDKPTGFTSREIVNRAQRWFPPRTRMGHTGTLDPLATGVLVLCIGAATRLTEYVQHMSKIYRAGISLGATSDTDDAAGQVTPMPNAKIPTDAEVMQAIAGFIGTFDQVPPAYSAAKVTGQRAYDLARKGKDVVLSPRPVTIYAIDAVRFAYPHLDLVVRCGKGTYIRSLARDLGERLGCGGYITSLRRTEVGCFKEADALPLNVEPLRAQQSLLPLSYAVSELPRITLDKLSATRLLQGQHLVSPMISTATEVAVFDDAGRLLAIADVTDGVLHAKKGLVGVDSV
jgi:tRNA pseudouridine55 synthase